MSDTDTYNIVSPQTAVLVAFAAKNFYQNLIQQGPSTMQKYYQQQVNYWDGEARRKALQFQMKQPVVTRAQH